MRNIYPSHVDDIITSNNGGALFKHISNHNHIFVIKDLGLLHYFLCVKAHWAWKRISLSQTKYIAYLFKRAKMGGAKTSLVIS